MSNQHHSKKTFRSKSSDHVPVIPTMVSTNTTGVKRIHVFRNGDVFFPGIQVVVNTHRTPSINVLLDSVSEKIGLINGAKKLYTTSGVLVKDINVLKDNQNYVASSSHFTPLAYGGEKVAPKPKRSKSTKSKERKHHKKKEHENGEISKVPIILPNVEEEIVIPLNHDEGHKVVKKKKKVLKKHHKKEEPGDTKFIDIPRRGSMDTTIGTAEIDLPSEIEDSEDDHNEHHERKKTGNASRGRPMTKEHDSNHHSEERHGTRSESRRGSVKSHKEEKHESEHEHEHEEKGKDQEKRRKSVSKKKSSQPNWGDLSSFTQNIESLLKK